MAAPLLRVHRYRLTRPALHAARNHYCGSARGGVAAGVRQMYRLPVCRRAPPRSTDSDFTRTSVPVRTVATECGEWAA